MADNPLLELTDTEYQQWRHSLQTRAFLRYLEDQAAAYRRELMERWEAKLLTPSEADEIRGVVTILEQLSNLPLQVIRRFYLGDSEAPAAETPPRRAAGR